MSKKTETMWMAWHKGEEFFLPDLYAESKSQCLKQIQTHCRRIEFMANYEAVKVQITQIRPKEKKDLIPTLKK